MHYTTTPPHHHSVTRCFTLWWTLVLTRGVLLCSFHFLSTKKKLYINKFIVLNSNHIKTCDFLDFMTGSVSCSNRIWKKISTEYILHLQQCYDYLFTTKALLQSQNISSMLHIECAFSWTLPDNSQSHFVSYHPCIIPFKHHAHPLYHHHLRLESSINKAR